MTFEQALAFLQRIGNQFLEGEEANKDFYCTTHKRIHHYGFWNFIVGNYVGLDTEEQIIEWAMKLRPNSIEGLTGQ